MSWAHNINSQNIFWQFDHQLVIINDSEFKLSLDKYKYFERYNDLTQEEYKIQCLPYISLLESKLRLNKFLLGQKSSFVDVAIMPFIRQFFKVDETWFNQSEFQAVKRWLELWLNSNAFKLSMKKHEVWQENSAPVCLY